MSEEHQSESNCEHQLCIENSIADIVDKTL